MATDSTRSLPSPCASRWTTQSPKPTLLPWRDSRTCSVSSPLPMSRTLRTLRPLSLVLCILRSRMPFRVYLPRQRISWRLLTLLICFAICSPPIWRSNLNLMRLPFSACCPQSSLQIPQSHCPSLRTMPSCPQLSTPLKQCRHIPVISFHPCRSCRSHPQYCLFRRFRIVSWIGCHFTRLHMF